MAGSNRFLWPDIYRDSNPTRLSRIQQVIKIDDSGPAYQYNDAPLWHLVEVGAVNLSGVLGGSGGQQENY